MVRISLLPKVLWFIDSPYRIASFVIKSPEIIVQYTKKLSQIFTISKCKWKFGRTLWWPNLCYFHDFRTILTLLVHCVVGGSITGPEAGQLKSCFALKSSSWSCMSEFWIQNQPTRCFHLISQIHILKILQKI